MSITLSRQQKKALNINKNVVLTANAGSGKTFILSKRFLETIIQKEVKVGEIAAITFTEKAAGELLKRISEDIDKFLQTDVNPNEKIRLQKFRELILSTKISTIHSFCSDILKHYPIEAGIDSNFTVIEDSVKNEVVEQVINEVVVEQLTGERVKNVLRIFGKDHLFKKLRQMINKQYLADKIIKKLFVGNFENYIKKIDDLYEDYFFHDSGFEKVYELINDLSYSLKYLKDEKISEVESVIKEFKHQSNSQNIFKIFELLNGLGNALFANQFGNIRKSYLLKGISDSKDFLSFQTRIIKRVNYFRNFLDLDCFNLEYEKLRYEHALIIIDLYKSIKQKYDEVKLLDGSLDYDDLLLKTNDLLENVQVKEELSRSLKYLLVDEFQDTDSLQFSILKKITNNLDSEHFLFVVGDEKQSIYGFRSAEIKVFQNAKKIISDKNFPEDKFIFRDETLDLISDESRGIISLPENYRLLPNILAFVNHIFKSLMQSSPNIYSKNYDEKVEYSELVYGRGLNDTGKVEIIFSNLSTDASESELEAEKIANKILELKKLKYKVYKKTKEGEKLREVEFRDFGILFRLKDDFKAFERAFARRKIPYTITGGKGFYQTEEITDWINYFRFLANPSNDAALVTILRSPFFAISDNVLFRISQAEVNGPLFEKLRHLVINNDSTDLPLHSYLTVGEMKRIYQLLSSQIKLAGRYPIPQLIQNILHESAYQGVISQSDRKDQILANVDKLLDHAAQFESTGFSDLYDFAEYLHTGWESVPDVGEAPISEIMNSVKLMTIHQAKGLEFPIVIIPKCERPIQKGVLKYGELEIEENSGIIFKIATEEGNIFTKSSLIGQHIKSQVNFSEALRVLYVALTRARDYLIISAEKKENKNFDPESYIGIILNGLNIDSNSQIQCAEVKTKIKKFTSGIDSIVNNSEDFTLKVDFTHSVSPQDEMEKDISVVGREKIKEIHHEKLIDYPKGEIFTATQLNVFNLCPTKYFLKNVLGFKGNKQSLFEEIDIEEKENILSPVEYGSLIHKLFENISNPDSVGTNLHYNDDEIEKLISVILKQNNLVDNIELRAELVNLFKKIQSTSIFKEIFSKPNFKTEFELQTKFGEHFLRGIIDRLIIEEDKIVIIDFKTDNFKIEKYEEKVSEYKVQMNFYALLVSKFFGEEKQIELILYFINHPNKPYRKIFTDVELRDIGISFMENIQNIITQNFVKNLSHCRLCEYFISNDCLI